MVAQPMQQQPVHISMKWEGFTGTITRPTCEAKLELMDLPEAFWQAKFSWMLPQSTSFEVKSFEEGELEQAYAWCNDQIYSYEQRQRLAGANT